MGTKESPRGLSGPPKHLTWIRKVLHGRHSQLQDDIQNGLEDTAPPPYETASLFAEKSSRLKPGAIEDFYDRIPETQSAERHSEGETCCVKVEQVLQLFESFSEPTFSKVLSIIPGRLLSRFRYFLYRQLCKQYAPSLIHDTRLSTDDRYFGTLGQLLDADLGHQRLFGSRTLKSPLQHDLNKTLEAHYYRHVRALGLDEYHVRRTIISAARMSRGITVWGYTIERMAEKGAFETMLTKTENDFKTLEVTAPSYDEEVPEEIRGAIEAVRLRYFVVDAGSQAVNLTRFAKIGLCPNCSCSSGSLEDTRDQDNDVQEAPLMDSQNSSSSEDIRDQKSDVQETLLTD